MDKATRANRNAIQEQFGTVIGRGTLPVFELEIKDEDGSEDYLLVNVSIGDVGVYFSFNDEYDTAFDGEIEKHGGSYLVKYDEWCDSLDAVLELVHENIIEGYIIPNNLLRN